MANDDGNLLHDVQRDALDSQVPLADTLRKLVALGGVAGSAELRRWASLELSGYRGSEEPLPSYREPAAVLHVDAVRGNWKITQQPITPRWLPKFAQEHLGESVRLNQPVGEIEAILDMANAQGGSVRLSLPGGQDLAVLMNQESNVPYQHIISVYWVLGAPSLAGVLDSIRTALVELVAEMRAGMPASEDVPSREVADHAVSVVVGGEGNRVTVTAPSASGAGAHVVTATVTTEVDAAWPALRQELADLGVPDAELDELRVALLTDGDPRGRELGEATTSWLGRLAMKMSSGAIALGSAASTEVISHAILKALGLS